MHHSSGTPRRRHSPIPVAPPRIPSPMPPPGSYNGHHAPETTLQQQPQPQPVPTVPGRVPGSEGRRGPPVKPRPHPLPSCRYLDEEGGAPWINPRLVHAMAAAAAAAAAANTGEQQQFIQTPRQTVALVSTRGGGGERSSIMPTTTTSSTPQQQRGTGVSVPVLTVLDPAPFSAHRDMELPNRTHRHHHHHHHHQRNQQAVYAEPFLQMQAAAAAAASSSAAAAFFARAAQKLNLQSPAHRRKRHCSGDAEEAAAAGVVKNVTEFSAALQRSPPPVPPALLRRIGVREVSTVGKVKVMLRVASPAVAADASSTTPLSSSASVGSFFSVDARRKQVTLFDPAACGGSSAAPEDRRVGVAAPKMFAFDAIFTADDSQSEVCASALTDVIHAVINGSDGVLFCFGHARLGKTHTMLGNGDSSGSLGAAPCAISWLFRGINEQKQKTGARFSVRVSAVEVVGQSQQTLRDLLAGHANDCEQSPGVYLRDDPLLGAQLQQHSELRVPTAERAAFYLDAAVAARSTSQRGAAQGANEDSHFLFTLHVYQYSVDRSGKGGVAGGRSRLHLLDLGSCERGRAGGGIPLSGVANVLLAIFNGQKHLPYREHKVTQLLRECLGSLTCHVAMIAHVSPLAQHYAETLTAVQLAARIHRMRRRRIKFGCATGGAGSGGSSGEDTRATGAAGGGNSSSDVDPSSSEQSADTVIYVGPCGDDATDGEHPPVYIPSLNSGDNRCAMGKALRGSAAERPRGSPAKSAKSSSADSSPARSLATRTPARAAATTTAAPKSPQVTRQTKTGKVVDPKTGKSSDEQWIDGPRISRSKVAEARSLLKEKRETWVDGPQAGSGQTATASTTGSQVGYGFMDNHKKTMIQRWVENQTVQIQQKLQRTHEYKELTVFKTCEEETEPAATVTTSQPVQQPTQSSAPQPDEAPSEPVLTSVCEHDEAEDEEDDALGELPPPLPLLLPHNKEISIDVSLDNYDVRMRILQERRLQGASIGDDDEVEIIEVEEPEEPVPMQDSCLQVTEEDIALCMGELLPPLMFLGAEDSEEHPLRVLSQENLTVVSTFTDSLSVISDLERGISSGARAHEEPSAGLARQLDQLARLHELYRGPRESPVPSGPTPSRCQSLSLSEMLYGSANPSPTPAENKMCAACRQVMSRGLWYPSLAVEGSQLCSQHLARPPPEPVAEVRPQPAALASLRHPDGASNPNLDRPEERRFPGNGASGSDHEDEAITEQTSIERTVTGKSDDEETPIAPAAVTTTPSSVGAAGSKTPRLTRLFAGARRSPGKSPQHEKKGTGSKKKASRVPSSEGYDSGLDSVIVVTRTGGLHLSTSAGGTGKRSGTSSSGAHCESSGYESVQRDSECSSLASSHESNESPPATETPPPPPPDKKGKQSAGTSTPPGPTGWWRLFPSCARSRVRTPSVDW